MIGMSGCRILSRLLRTLYRKFPLISNKYTSENPPEANPNRSFSNTNASSHQFVEFTIKTPRFNLIIARLTTNTYVLVVFPPGEAELECTRLNVLSAKDEFSQLDGIAEFRYRDG